VNFYGGVVSATTSLPKNPSVAGPEYFAEGWSELLAALAVSVSKKLMFTQPGIFSVNAFFNLYASNIASSPNTITH
jgi:hypothetical protein